jgi:multiple sugar transport system permease protein
MITTAVAPKATARPASVRRRTPWEWANIQMKWLFALPAAIFVLAMLVVPMAYTVYLSFTDAHGAINRPKAWAGLDNYTAVLSDTDRFWPAVGRTLWFSAGTVIIELVLGMAIALLLRKPFRGQSVVRSLILLPLVATPVAVSMAWLLIFEPTVGIVNYVLRTLGLPTQGWFTDPSQALNTFIFVDVWQWTPIMVLILLAGMMVLPDEPYEAAAVDGASGWQRFRFLTIPLLGPSIMTAVILRAIDAIKAFDMLYAIKNTGGGSQHEVETLNIYGYGLNLEYQDYGMGSALLVIFFVMILFVVYLMVKGQQRWGAMQ